MTPMKATFLFIKGGCKWCLLIFNIELLSNGLLLTRVGKQGNASAPSTSDTQSTKCLISNDTSDNLTIEGGTISISTVYSQGLFNSFTQSTGLDLSQANLSLQIDLGQRGLTTGTSAKVQHMIKEGYWPPVG
ncbi:hypothetical protein V6N11_050367 [Hibiscus sabdariffa]|uniref:Uncharacterized protein n=1 Tax=Hibiscus sabdariffa TaxID=183260 RepID=A0ABR2TAF8_9ROSI